MTDNAMNPACKLCKYGRRVYLHGDVKGRVECRKEPRTPVAVDGDICHVFPVMEDDDYCSHFEPNKRPASIAGRMEKVA